jgi:hypothetical protein
LQNADGTIFVFAAMEREITDTFLSYVDFGRVGNRAPHLLAVGTHRDKHQEAPWKNDIEKKVLERIFPNEDEPRRIIYTSPGLFVSALAGVNYFREEKLRKSFEDLCLDNDDLRLVSFAY